MEIDLTGLDIDFFWIAVGLTLMGYFIGKGLQNIGQPNKGPNYYFYIKENELEFHLNLNKKEIEELLSKYPNAPMIELNGTKYYPYKQFMEWISSNAPYK